MNLAPKQPTRHSDHPEIGTLDVRRKIAEELSSARKFHEMSLEQISAITKINAVYLKNLEEAEWSFLPPVYIKLFIKAFADAVGIQSDEFYDRLSEVFSSTAPYIPALESQGELSEMTGVKRQTVVSNLLLWIERYRSILFYGFITVVVLGLIAFYLLRPPRSSDVEVSFSESQASSEARSQDSAATAEAETTVVEPVRTAGEETVSEHLPSVVTEPTTFSPTFVSEDYCYIRIEHGDSILYDKVLYPGNRYTSELPFPVKVILQNAPSMRIVIGDDTLPRFSADREVRVFRLGPDGIVR